MQEVKDQSFPCDTLVTYALKNPSACIISSNGFLKLNIGMNTQLVALHHHRHCKSSAYTNNTQQYIHQTLSWHTIESTLFLRSLISCKTCLPLDRGISKGGRKKTLNPKRVKTGWCLGVGFLSAHARKSALYEGCDNTSLRAPHQYARDLNNDRP